MEPTITDPAGRVARRMELVSRERRGVGFLDPATLLMLAQIVIGVIKFCQERSAIAIHRQIARRPDGVTASKLKTKLRVHFAEIVNDDDHLLFADQAEVDKHVGVAMTALAGATAGEFRDLLRDVQWNNAPPTIPFNAAAAARDWSSVE